MQRIGLILILLMAMLVCGAATLFVTALVLMELGLKYHGNYEYYAKYQVLVLGPAAIGFLLPGIVYSYLLRRNYIRDPHGSELLRKEWAMVARFVLMFVSGFVTYTLLSLMVWKVSLGYFSPIIAFIFWGLTAIGFLAPAFFDWPLSKVQFSLRTLLIATTLIAFVLGFVVWFSS